MEVKDIDIVKNLKWDDWYVYKIASGNLAISNLESDCYCDINVLKNVIKGYYGERYKEGAFLKEALLIDEYFLDIYIDEIKFNLGYDIAGVCFMTYEKEGNPYILEIADYINKKA